MQGVAEGLGESLSLSSSSITGFPILSIPHRSWGVKGWVVKFSGLPQKLPAFEIKFGIRFN